VGAWWEHGEAQMATPAQLCAHGWGRLNRGEASEALVFFREAAALDDWDPAPRWGLHQALQALGRETEAAEALRQYQEAAALHWTGGALGGPLLVGEPEPGDPGTGIGDVVQGARWLAAAAQRAGAPVVLRCRKSLHGLLATVPGCGDWRTWRRPCPGALPGCSWRRCRGPCSGRGRSSGPAPT
jgi:hypothetical protein